MQPAIHVEYNDDRISAPIEIPEDIPTPEAIRRTHVNAETSIRAIGHLLLLSVVLGGIALFRSLGQMGQSPAAMLDILASVGFLIGNGISGAWLGRLDSRGRLLYTGLFFLHLALLAFQAPGLCDQLSKAAAAMTTTQVDFHRTYYALLSMTLIPQLVRTLVLYVLWSRKARMVMTEHYQTTIIPATPQIKYRSRVPLLILLGVVLAIGIFITLVIMSA